MAMHTSGESMTSKSALSGMTANVESKPTERKLVYFVPTLVNLVEHEQQRGDKCFREKIAWDDAPQPRQQKRTAKKPAKSGFAML